MGAVKPTPVLERSHTWRERFVPARDGQKARVEIRPSRIGVSRYGIRDLGWQVESKYLTKAGKLTKAATS